MAERSPPETYRVRTASERRTENNRSFAHLADFATCRAVDGQGMIPHSVIFIRSLLPAACYHRWRLRNCGQTLMYSSLLRRLF